METTDIFTKVLHPADYQNWNRTTWPIFVKVHYRMERGKDRLSITGVEGPKRNGNADGSCGQISLPEVYQPAPGWTVEMVTRLWEIWDRWHLNDLFEVKNREQKAIGWLKPDEHPDGMLNRPCDVCGYKYGSAWLHEPVPAEVIAELRAFPDTDIAPAWI